MNHSAVRILSNRDVKQALDASESELVDIIARAYQRYEDGSVINPTSAFMRLPSPPRSRIIALPSFSGGERPLAGLKWVSSFPGNLERGLPRASAVMMINYGVTGRVRTILDGTDISSQRTAASAAVAARALLSGRTPEVMGVVGCGPINREIINYVKRTVGSINRLCVHDLDPDRGERFAASFAGTDLEAATVSRIDDVFATADLIAFATNAIEPYVPERIALERRHVILHISLRDLQPGHVVDARNCVDDANHAFSSQTSLHLAEQATGRRDFLTATIGALIADPGLAERKFAGAAAVFSPFGLGVLDLAVAEVVENYCIERNMGTTIDDFFTV
ncbi:MAG: 2,3-diaminopropionate biosynthesis protein SbnB [Proteobacteria bacterium]|nr:2,3-diaminopropionate biosynthesis protein SbnB [Pseudomonadota bacterium]